MHDYDVVVIGGGPGGYVAAIRAAQLGLKTACVEGRGALGGTCLNVGCIPSKALLTSSEKFAEAVLHLAGHGIALSGVTLNLAAMMARKIKVVGDLTKGIEFLFRKNGVDFLRGWGSIPNAGTVDIKSADGEVSRVSAKHIVIATGSEPVSLPGLNIDEIKIVSSTGALELTQVPKRLAVIGAGVIGLELGQVWSRLGAQVTVIEFLDRILPSFDAEIAKTAQRALSKRGLKFCLGRQVTGVETTGDVLVLDIRRKETGALERLEADVVLVAVGRRPVTTRLGLDRLDIARDQLGFIKVDHRFKTSVDGIYAIGDCVPGPMLAHKAEEDGVACVEGLAGLDSHVDYALVPSVVYTTPEVAGVGLAQEQLEASGVVYRTGSFPFIANSRARASGETDGLVKILAAEDGRILGAHIVGPHGGDLLAELVLAMKHGVKAADVAGVCHAHPSLGEAVKEACLAVSARAIHC